MNKMNSQLTTTALKIKVQQFYYLASNLNINSLFIQLSERFD